LRRCAAACCPRSDLPEGLYMARFRVSLNLDGTPGLSDVWEQRRSG
jgi:hypothetical protein